MTTETRTHADAERTAGEDAGIDGDDALRTFVLFVAGTGMQPLAFELDVPVGFGERTACVVVRKVMEETGAADAEDALGVETEKVHSVVAVVGDVGSEVEFREPDPPTIGDPRRADVDVREQDVSPAHVECCYHGSNTSIWAPLGSRDAAYTVRFLQGW
jgi:hypothetical protein